MASAPSASDSRWYPDTGSNVHLTNKLSNLNMHAKDYTGIDQIRVGNVQGLHILHFGRGIYLHLHIIFIYCHSYMPLKSRKTLYLSTNSLVITTFSLNFIHIFSVLRTSKPSSCSSKARVSSASIYGHHLMLLLPSLLLPSLVRKSPWINGISSWVIQLLLLSVKSSNQISCPWLPQSFPPFAPHVSRARVIVFISVALLLFPAILYNCCFLMYEVLLLSIM
jgi:hypothetical protein